MNYSYLLRQVGYHGTKVDEYQKNYGKINPALDFFKKNPQKGFVEMRFSNEGVEFVFSELIKLATQKGIIKHFQDRCLEKLYCFGYGKSIFINFPIEDVKNNYDSSEKWAGFAQAAADVNNFLLGHGLSKRHQVEIALYEQGLISGWDEFFWLTYAQEGIDKQDITAFVKSLTGF